MSDNFNDDFYNLVKERIAKISVGASTIQKMGSTGMLAIIHSFLETVDLDTFFNALTNKEAYSEYLDIQTEALKTEFIDVAPNNWGAARKCLNLFFREIVYNKFLCEKYHLPVTRDKYDNAIQYLEVPLDSKVARAIIKRNQSLPKWVGVTHLSKENSSKYQAEAIRIAEEEFKTVTVHLDLVFFVRAR